MSSKTRKYDKQFKEQAVDLYYSSSKTHMEVAKELGMPASTLGRWGKQKKKNPDNPFPGKGKLRPDDARQREIIKENNRLKRERDILKKALAIFSKGPKRSSNL